MKKKCLNIVVFDENQLFYFLKNQKSFLNTFEENDFKIDEFPKSILKKGNNYFQRKNVTSFPREYGVIRVILYREFNPKKETNKLFNFFLKNSMEELNLGDKYNIKKIIEKSFYHYLNLAPIENFSLYQIAFRSFHDPFVKTNLERYNFKFRDGFFN